MELERVLRRLAGKAVTIFLKKYINLAVGSLQPWAGQVAKVEAAIHNMHDHNTKGIFY